MRLMMRNFIFSHIWFAIVSLSFWSCILRHNDKENQDIPPKEGNNSSAWFPESSKRYALLHILHPYLQANKDDPDIF